MNRRNFISICQQIVVGCALGVGLVSTKPKAKLNPEWVNAEYRFHFFCDENAYKTINVGPPPSSPFDTSNYKSIGQLIHFNTI